MDDDPYSFRGNQINDQLGCRKNSTIYAITRYCKAGISILWLKMVRELVENKERIKILTILS